MIGSGRASTATRCTRAALVALVLLLPLVVAPTPTSAATDTGATDRWVVRFAPGSSASSRLALLTAADVEVLDVATTLRFALVAADDAGVGRLRVTDGVETVRRPVPVRAFATPNDPFFSQQWNLGVVQAPAAWDVANGRGATVAVLDTGVRRSLPDLAGTRFTAGIDLVEADGDPDDEQGHGTHVAGTIAQTTNNGVGVAGLAFGATVMPIRVLDAGGAGDDYLLARGIEYAVTNGADVLNLSLGASSSSVLLYEAIQLAAGAGVTIVAAVGNEGADRISFPAAYEEVIAVGAVGQALTRAPYSNRGPELDLVAPGGDTSQDVDGDGYGDGILQQTFRDDEARTPCYCFYQGTSMAAPHVAAAAALLVSAGVTDAATIRGALLSTARDLGPAGPDPSTGRGLLQVADALRMGASAPTGDAPTSPPPTEDPTGDLSPQGPSTAPGSARSTDRACPPGEVPDASFADVDDASVHAPPIDCVAWREIAKGVSATRYAPSRAVTRGQMATFLSRAIAAAGGDLPSAPPDAFTDDDGSPHEDRIDELAALGILKGQLDRVYRPDEPVSRAQMATFLGRTITYLTGRTLEATVDHFLDDEGSVHEQAINAVAEAGIAAGVGPGSFAPDRAVQRDQMASFLARALDLVLEAAEG